MAEKKKIMERLKDMLPQFVKDHPTSFCQGFIVALSGAFEQLWEEVGFKCPSYLDSPYNTPSMYERYAVLNVLGPGLLLWMICLLGSNMAMRSCQGYCCRMGKTTWENCCYAWGSVIFRSLVIPLTWVFVALIDGDFLACYNYLPTCDADRNTMFIDGINCTTNITLWNHAKKIESQTYGWYLLMGCLVILFGVFISRCCSKRTYFPNLYSNKLKKLERAGIEMLLEKEAEQTAAKNAAVIMMTVNDMTPKDWEVISREHPKETYTFSSNDNNDVKENEYYVHPSPCSEWLAYHPELVKEYEKREIEKAEKAKAEKAKSSANQVLTPNPTPAPPQNSVPAN